LLVVLLLIVSLLPTACRTKSNTFVVALSDPIRTIDPIGSPSVDAASERVRTLMWDLVGIVRSDERLARAEDQLTELRTVHEDRWRRTRWTVSSRTLPIRR